MLPRNSVEEIPFKDRLEFTFDYIDKEITAMGWLVGLSATLGGAAISQPLLRIHDKEMSLGWIVGTYPESAMMMVGCLLLFGASICFLSQRIKLTTRYGFACQYILDGDDPTDILTDLIQWKSWRLYTWGVRLFAIGVLQVIGGLIFLMWSVGQYRASFSYGEVLLWALGIPMIAIVVSTKRCRRYPQVAVGYLRRRLRSTRPGKDIG